MSLLVTFPGTTETSPDRVGGKASSLIRMAAAGYRVPPGAVLTTEFFAPWFAEVHLSAAWKAFRDDASDQWSECCAELKAVVARLQCNAAQRQALAQLEASLPRSGGVRFAVRSSAPDEDLSSMSFAGGYATRLGVSPHELEEAIRCCCASALDARVFAYKRESGLDVYSPRIAVIVQQQIASEVAGVGFSLNPLTNDYDEAVIDATWGLGEAVVSGRVTPDHWVVDKVTRKPLELKAGAKQLQIVLAEEGGLCEAVSDHQDELSLTSAQVSELTDLIVRLEAFFAQPVDIEWAYANDAFHVLQARPISRYVPLPPELTTAPGERRRLYMDGTLSKGMTMNAPVSVLGLDAIERSLSAIIESWIGPIRRRPSAEDALFLFAGARMYANLSNALWLASPRMLAKGNAPNDILISRILAAIDRKRYRSAARPQWLGAKLLWLVPRLLWGLRGLLWSTIKAAAAPERASRAYPTS